MKSRIFASLFLILALNSQPALSQAIDDSISNEVSADNLSDQDRWTSENYVHEGLEQRTMQELCNADEDSQKACAGQEAQKKFMGLSPSMVGALSKAYTLVIGASDLGKNLVTKADYEKKNPSDPKDADSADTKTPEKTPDTNDPNTKTADNGNNSTTDGESKEETNNDDYCRYIPVVTETIATFQQTSSGDTIKSIPTNQETAQKDQMYKVALAHEDRADISKMQMTGWGATTACYGAMMARPSISKKAWQNWAKLASAGLLTTFFKSQVNAHEDYAGKVRTIADKLPGKGDCNPITDKACYCAQEETMYDTANCSDQIKEKAIANANDLSITCVDNKLNADPSCNCKKSNTCYSEKFISNVNGLNLGSSFKSSVLDPVGNLSNGVLTSGKLDSGNTKLFAVAQKEMGKAANHLSTSKPLSKAQKQEADAFEKLGLSKSAARRLAAMPTTPAMKKNRSVVSRMGQSPRRYSNYRRSNKSSNKVLRFGGGSGLNKKKRVSRSKTPNYLKGLRKKKSRSRNNGKVLKFAERAQNSAQISNNKERPIFDIISRRYKVSGWKRLEVE